MTDMMGRCWEHDPKDRMCFQEVMTELSAVYNALQAHSPFPGAQTRLIHGSPGGPQFEPVWGHNTDNQVVTPSRSLFQSAATARDSSGRRIDRDSSEEGPKLLAGVE